MNFKRKCLLFFALFYCCLSGNAQMVTPPNYFLPQIVSRSPTSTALEKYGTYQVNEFTGVPDISIPLYTVDAGGFQMPVTLSYHASGIKVTDVAGWVGAGWSVAGVGGQISRRTMGLPDDYTYGYLFGFMMHPNSHGGYNTNTIQALDSLEYSANNTYDSRPDIYSYDFPGHSGKFFFDGSPGNNYIPRMVPFAPLRVGYTLVAGQGLANFNITDEHGNIYTYGDSGATEITFSQSGGTGGYNIASAWKMENMISQNRRDTVSFTYQKDTVKYPAMDNEVYTVIDNVNNITPGIYSPSYTSAPVTYGNINVTTEELPRQISFKNGKVVFDLDSLQRTDLPGSGSHAYGLKDIKVYRYNYGSKLMELQKTVVFYKSYFNPSSAPRLRLDSIQVLDKAGSIMQHYKFDYNTGTALPVYTSFAQDYWGYYNGQTGNTMLTPAQSIQYTPGGTETVTIGQANRNPNNSAMQADVLTGVHYPSGGYSTFTYQANRYDTSGVAALAGGLRIQTISSYDGISATPIVKTYVYDDAAAKKNFFLDYAYFVSPQMHRYYQTGREDLPTMEATAMFRSFSSNPHCDLEAYDATTVCYPAVTEYMGTPGTNVGRTDYTFSFVPDALSSASFAGTLVYFSAFYQRGHLLAKKEFIHNADGTYQPVMLTVNSYTAFPPTDYAMVGLAVKKNYYNEGATTNPIPPADASPDDSANFNTNPYDIISDDNYLTGTTVNIYDTNDSTKFTTSATTYKYDNFAHQQVTQTVHTDSKGNTMDTKTQYPADYTAGNPVIDNMVSRNMQAEAIEKVNLYANAATGVNAVTGGQLNVFKAGGIANTIVPSKIYTLSVAAPLTNFVPSTVTSGALTNDSRYVQMINFADYDTNNNLTEYKARNGPITTILWDYLGENPVAQVKNASTNGVAYTSFEASKNGWTYGTPNFDATAPTGSMSYPLSAGAVTSPNFSTSQPYILSLWANGAAPTVYTGSGYLTATSLNTLANGWNYYEYPVPTGSGHVTLSGSTSVDEIRVYPVNAQMVTYAYDPSGVRTIADTKGMNSFFEYDFAQRLKNIKDWAGNVVKNFGYHMYDQTFGNYVQTAIITRNNCPNNTTPGALTYSVPSNKYYSSTILSANTDALYDLNTNGQIKANQFCACNNYLIFTVNNSTTATFSISFSGITAPYNVAASGTTLLQVPPNTYATMTVNANDSNTHTYTLGTNGARPPQNAHNYSFTTVYIATGSSDLTLAINP